MLSADTDRPAGRMPGPDPAASGAAPDRHRRIVVFTASSCPAGLAPSATIEHIEAVAAAFPDWDLVVLHERPSGPRKPRPLARIRRRVPRLISHPLDALHRLLARPRRRERRGAGAVGLPPRLEDIGL